MGTVYLGCVKVEKNVDKAEEWFQKSIGANQSELH